jgi:ABC-type lipoprotein export system ATPase subunit
VSRSSKFAACARSIAWERWTCPALRGVDLDVPPGEFLAIVGPSGSGKSTLFHIIGGLTPATGGTVRIGGQDISSLTDAGRTELRKKKVGFVFQKFNLLPNLTAGDNIAIARHIAGRGQAPSPNSTNCSSCWGFPKDSTTSPPRFPEASSSA